jgi:S1-C subfamily serine protease
VSTVSLARRRQDALRARHPRPVYLLAVHASLPAAVNSELLHHLRDNFLLDGPVSERLPITPDSEAQMARLLLSPLFSAAGEDLYEMDPAVRTVLLSELGELAGGQRIKDVAALLDRYTHEESPWAAWPELVNAQLVSALAALDPQRADEFLEAGVGQGGGAGVDERWFIAMRQRVAQDRAAASAAPVAADNVAAATQPPQWPEAEQAVVTIQAANIRGTATRLTSFGILVTAAHVVDRVGTTVSTTGLGNDPHHGSATVVAVDSEHDLAFLVEALGSATQPTAVLISGTESHADAQVVSVDAIGGQQSGRVTDIATFESPPIRGERITSDIRLRPGGSGAPLLDTSGRLVGIAQALFDRTDHSVFIPTTAVIAALAGFEATQFTTDRKDDTGPNASDVDILLRVGSRASAEGRRDSAREWLELALIAARSSGVATLVAPVLTELADVADPNSAARLLDEAAMTVRSIEDPTIRGPLLARVHDVAARVLGESAAAMYVDADPSSPAASGVPQMLVALASQYDEAASLEGGQVRTERKTQILDEIRAANPPADLLPALTTSAAPGLRFVGVVILQAQPDASYLEWLADRLSTRNDSEFTGYHAAVALRNAAELLPPAALDAVEAAIERGQHSFEAAKSSDRATALAVAKSIVVRRRSGHDATASGDDMVTHWKLWKDRSTLQVRFLDGDAARRSAVERLAPQWVVGTGLDFEFLPTGSKSRADLRVSFEAGQTWSYVGTDALTVPAGSATMSIDQTLSPGSSDFRQAVLKCFGYALGLLPEHQSPNASVPWDLDALYRKLSGPPYHHTREQINQNYLRHYSLKNPDYRPFDPKSVMLAVPPELVHGARLGGTTLSKSDRSFIAFLYPPKGTARRASKKRSRTKK